jgi:hypothetical protein
MPGYALFELMVISSLPVPPVSKSMLHWVMALLSMPLSLEDTHAEMNT